MKAATKTVTTTATTTTTTMKTTVMKAGTTRPIRMLAALAFAASTAAFAHGSVAGDLAIEHPYALPTPAGATTGGAYLRKIDNKGAAPDTLVGASSPAADRVELHNMTQDGDVMRMREVPSIAIAPGKPVTMSPGGGYHLMMIGLHKPLAVGDQVPMTLRFEHAGKVDVMLHVQERAAAMAADPKK